MVSDDQPDAREGQVGRLGVAERFAVPLKPGNAGGGKGPQFKTDATSGEDLEIGRLAAQYENESQRGRRGLSQIEMMWRWVIFRSERV